MYNTFIMFIFIDQIRYNQHVPWGLQAFGCYIWTGTPLRLLLERVGVTDECIDVVFTGYDAGLEKEKEVRYRSIK